MLYNKRMDKFHALATRPGVRLSKLWRGRDSYPHGDRRSVPHQPQAISQHLKVLRETRWVQVEKRAQQRIYRINLEATDDLENWAHGCACSDPAL